MSDDAELEDEKIKVDMLEAESRSCCARIASLEATVAKLREALTEAIDLRVKLFRHGDIEGDTGNWSDEKVAKSDSYARKWLAALDAVAAVDGDAGWRPIETAPRDGTHILVFGPSNSKNKTYMDVCAWPNNWDGMWPVAYMAYAAGEPTHWMPLPSPPSAH